MAFFDSGLSRFGIVDTEAIYARADDGGVFTNEDTPAANASANDMTLLPAVEVINDAYYFGASGKFAGVLLNIGTPGVGTAITWEYYNGAAWVALTLSDESSGFTAAAGQRLITFDPPSAWAATTINGVSAFWVRARCSTASFTTQPLGTQAWLVKDLSPYIISINGLPGTRELNDVTALGDTGRKWFPALQDVTITLELNWSDDAGGGPDTVLGALRDHTAAVHFNYGPEGRDTGDIKYSGTCWVRNYEIVTQTGSQVKARAEIKVEGVVTRGTYT